MKIVEKRHVKRILRNLAFVIGLMIVALAVGLVLGNRYAGTTHYWNVFQWQTWQHLLSFWR